MKNEGSHTELLHYKKHYTTKFENPYYENVFHTEGFAAVKGIDFLITKVFHSIQFLQKININSTSNKGPYNFCTEDFNFFHSFNDIKKQGFNLRRLTLHPYGLQLRLTSEHKLQFSHSTNVVRNLK